MVMQGVFENFRPEAGADIKIPRHHTGGLELHTYSKEVAEVINNTIHVGIYTGGLVEPR